MSSSCLKLQMAAFYDLCVGYDGVSAQARREVVAMAMQLGYSGIAFNHVVSGLLSDHDRCKIRPVDLQNVGAEIAQAATFHRQLLGVPSGTEFRQYSRVTVVLDDSSVTAVINSSPALRTYDLVAVQPTTLKAFSQACQQLEVDIISVDFDERLPFRMKLPLVKAAMERGIFFEIVYSRALFNLKVRMELFANSQMLQGWTRGRNIILSSGASSAVELRGPSDLANLCTLFGLSPENAKTAVSKNCRSTILHGVTRRKSYKGAISVERCPADGNLGSDKLLFDIPMIWDPLASILAENPTASAGFAPSSEANRDGGIDPFESCGDNSTGQAEDAAEAGHNTTAVVPENEPMNFLDTCRTLFQSAGAGFTNPEGPHDLPGQTSSTPVKRKSFDGIKTRKNLRAGDFLDARPGSKSGKRKLSAFQKVTGEQARKKQKSGKKRGKKPNLKRKP